MGESEAPGGGGDRFLLKVPGGGEGFLDGPRGREGVGGELGNFFGGGLNIFFRGRNVHQVLLSSRRSSAYREDQQIVQFYDIAAISHIVRCLLIERTTPPVQVCYPPLRHEALFRT